MEALKYQFPFFFKISRFRFYDLSLFQICIESIKFSSRGSICTSQFLGSNRVLPPVEIFFKNIANQILSIKMNGGTGQHDAAAEEETSMSSYDVISLSINNNKVLNYAPKNDQSDKNHDERSYSSFLNISLNDSEVRRCGKSSSSSSSSYCVVRNNVNALYKHSRRRDGNYGMKGWQRKGDFYNTSMIVVTYCGTVV